LPIRVLGEEEIESFKPLDQALGIVQAVDTDDQGSPAEARHQVFHQRRLYIASRQPLKPVRLDTDGETADPRLLPIQPESDPAARRLEHQHLATRILILCDEVADEISGIAIGLEAHHVILQQQRDELLVVRHRGKDLRRRHRDVQKKTDPVGVAAPSQRVRDRDQVIVVHPDQVVLPDYFFELGREMIIDPEISAEIPTRELGEIKPVMQNRPQHAVGEAVVIFLNLCGTSCHRRPSFVVRPGAPASRHRVGRRDAVPARRAAGRDGDPTRLLLARLAIRIVPLARIQTLRIVWRNARIIHRPAP
jgi:hypothetical protein